MCPPFFKLIHWTFKILILLAKELAITDDMLLSKILHVRNQKVMIDRDHAELYGVQSLNGFKVSMIANCIVSAFLFGILQIKLNNDLRSVMVTMYPFWHFTRSVSTSPKRCCSSAIAGIITPTVTLRGHHHNSKVNKILFTLLNKAQTILNIFTNKQPCVSLMKDIILLSV